MSFVKNIWHKFLRPIVGWGLIVVGFILAPTPVPIGIMMIIIGIFILGTNNPWVKWLFTHLKRLLQRGTQSPTPIIQSLCTKFLDFLVLVDKEVETKAQQEKDHNHKDT